MRRALVLAGGGNRGAFEVGAVEYLVCEAGLDFQIFAGTSVGALNCALLGQARNKTELIEQVKKLKTLWLGIKGDGDIYDRSPFGILRLFFQGALYRPVGLERLLKKHVDPKRLFEPATVVKVATVALETGELLLADSRRRELQKDFLSYILASASIPLFFPPVHIDGKHWYDGGLKDLTPLGAAFEERPDEIVAVLTYPIRSDLTPVLRYARPKGFVQTFLRIVEILCAEISSNDLQLAEMIDEHVLAFPGKRRVPIRIVAPDVCLSRNSLRFSPAVIREYMRRGYKAAQMPVIVGQAPKHGTDQA